jgi:hypothetical protein
MFNISIIRRGKALLNGIQLTYSSIGDTNGVVYYIGTNYLQSSFTNPHTSGRVTCVMSSVNGGHTAAELVDRAYNDLYTDNALGSFVGIDLGSGRLLKVNKYIIRGATSSGSYIRKWKLQGSNNVGSNNAAGFSAATWADLDTQTNNTTISSPSSAVAITVTGVSTSYRWLRILLSSGGDSDGANYLVCSDFEFYGTLVLQ